MYVAVWIYHSGGEKLRGAGRGRNFKFAALKLNVYVCYRIMTRRASTSTKSNVKYLNCYVYKNNPDTAQQFVLISNPVSLHFT